MKKIFYDYNKITTEVEWTWEQLMSMAEVKQSTFFDSASMILQEKKKRNVLIYTDYDTDGLTSGINLETILKPFFKEVIVTSNDKQYEGYNLTQKRIEKKMAEFQDQEAEVVIVTADVGVTDVKVMNWATGLDKVPYTITLDHHENHGELPKTTYLIDLKLPSNLGEVDREYCTAGITWLWAMKIAQDSGKDSLKETVLKLLPWTAVATIADMVPLNYGNFAIIEKGLAMVNNNEDYMYKKSMELFITKDDKYEQVSYLQELLSRDVGFTISPLINASTRMTGKTQMAIDAITSENFLTFNQLKSLNEKRKLATKVSEISSKTIFYENGFAVSFIDEKFLKQKLEAYNESHKGQGIDIDVNEAEELLGYASGLAGIVASTLLKETKGAKASFTGTSAKKTLEDGTVVTIFHGSLRARPGVNLVKALDAVKDAFPNAIKGGGHAGAAGLSINSSVKLTDVLRMMSVEIGKAEVEASTVFNASEFNVEEFTQLPLVFGMGRDIPAFKFTVNDLEIISDGWDFKFKRSQKGTMYFTPRVRFQGYEFAMNVFDSAYKEGFDFNNMCLVPGWGATQHGKELVFRPMERN